jgi:hypothetical protein
MNRMRPASLWVGLALPTRRTKRGEIDTRSGFFSLQSLRGVIVAALWDEDKRGLGDTLGNLLIFAVIFGADSRRIACADASSSSGS